MLLRTCLNNIKSVLNPRPKCHIRFLNINKVSSSQNQFENLDSYIAPQKVQVLNPENITYRNQPIIDLSGIQIASFYLLYNGEYQQVQLYYYFKEYMRSPFPENTHGYLYYCTPPQDRPPVSGSFRFRVLPYTSDPPKGFAEGTDLLRPDGRPWELPLYSAIHSQKYAPLVQKLLDEKLLDTDLLKTVAKLPRIYIRNSSNVLYTLSDPFTLSLGQDRFIIIITKDHLKKFRFCSPLIDLGRLPFTGILLLNILQGRI